MTLFAEYYERARDAARYEYVSRQEYEDICNALALNQPPGAIWHGPRGGVYLWGVEWIPTSD